MQYPPQGNQQPYYGQQPGTPAMQPGYAQPMMPQAPPKKPRRWPWIVAILVALIIGYAAGAGSHSATNTTATTTATATQPAPTQAIQPTTAPAKPTSVPKASAPAVLFSQSGNGELTTKTFTAPASWTLSWTCTPDATVGDAPLYINVISAGQDMLSGDISATCKVGNASGSSQESQSGPVSLHIISGIDWTVKAVAS